VASSRRRSTVWATAIARHDARLTRRPIAPQHGQRYPADPPKVERPQIQEALAYRRID